MNPTRTSHHTDGDYDVAIVGARVAGAATALELAAIERQAEQLAGHPVLASIASTPR